MLSFEERTVIYKLRANGQSIREIVRIIGRPRSTVQRVLKLPTNHTKKGPIDKLCGHVKRAIAYTVSRQTVINIPMIQQQLNLGCSRSTVGRALKALNFRYGTCKIIPHLMKRHLDARMAFSREKRSWTSNDWDKVLFSDEKRFTFAVPDGPIKSWMRKGGRKRIQKCNSQRSVMVWAAFSKTKKTDIVFVTGNLNSDLYIEILEHNLLPILDEGDIFQQDNASCHTSRITRSWFAENGVEVMPWPALSPDLNPIENLWAYMQRKVYEGARSFDNEQLLMDKIKDIWDEIPQTIIDNLIGSMNKRMELVLKGKGNRF